MFSAYLFVFNFFFRLNEGHTVYLERHICGRLFGEKFRHFHALGGWGELQSTVSELRPLQALKVDFSEPPLVRYQQENHFCGCRK